MSMSTTTTLTSLITLSLILNTFACSGEHDFVSPNNPIVDSTEIVDSTDSTVDSESPNVKSNIITEVEEVKDVEEVEEVEEETKEKFSIEIYIDDVKNREAVKKGVKWVEKHYSTCFKISFVIPATANAITISSTAEIPKIDGETLPANAQYGGYWDGEGGIVIDNSVTIEMTKIIVAHEFLHALGALHENIGIMQPGFSTDATLDSMFIGPAASRAVTSKYCKGISEFQGRGN